MASMKGSGGSGQAAAGVGNLLALGESASADRLNAFRIQAQGKIEARLIREEGVRTQSAQRAGFAKSGVELSGTPLEVMAETARVTEENARKAASTAQAKADQLRSQAKTKKRAVAIGGISTLFSGKG